ncbi:MULTISPECIES: helix-turn-helix transcriptional regulator [unclassified Endozoicomonas]|uniref:helix-turn-helix transcriptional regulator n=1 Tax=unclassified Endozoicomonas TaxID=2644528 RepID=UPI003BB7E066
MDNGLLFNLKSLSQWMNLSSKKEIVKNLHKLGIPFVELTNGEVVTLYSALERGFQKNAMEEAEELIRMDEVLKLTKACRASINNYVAQGSFPQKIQLGPRKVAWRKAEVLQWVEGKRDW